MTSAVSPIRPQEAPSPAPFQELTDGVDPQDPEEQEVVLLTQELVPEEDHQPGAREETCWTPHGEPQHRTTHTHPDAVSMLQVLLPGPVLSSVLPGQRASLQRPHLDVPVQDVQQSGELADQRVPLSHAHLPDRHQQLQLHLLAPAGLCRETPPSAAAGQR